MRRLALLLLLIPAAAAAELTPHLDVRVRQELLDGVLHFAPESDRNWIRVRTRAGLGYAAGDHVFTVRLNNEHRHMLDPDQELNWDEVIIDRLQWRWSSEERRTLTVGRQDNGQSHGTEQVNLSLCDFGRDATELFGQPAGVDHADRHGFTV